MIKMKKTWKKKWVAALRSGKYKQTRQQLAYKHNDGDKSYCCLGVLCDITGKRYKGNHAYPHKGITKLVFPKGVTHSQVMDDGSVYDSAALLNDCKRWSFKRIATWVEKNL